MLPINNDNDENGMIYAAHCKAYIRWNILKILQTINFFLPSSVPYRFIDTKMKVTVCKENTVSSKQSET